MVNGEWRKAKCEMRKVNVNVNTKVNVNVKKSKCKNVKIVKIVRKSERM